MPPVYSFLGRDLLAIVSEKRLYILESGMVLQMMHLSSMNIMY